jgi:hypothetical protein
MSQAIVNVSHNANEKPSKNIRRSFNGTSAQSIRSIIPTYNVVVLIRNAQIWNEGVMIRQLARFRFLQPIRLIALTAVVAMVVINFATVRLTVWASNCLAAADAPGCMYGLPTAQYQALEGIMAANPAPPGQPLATDLDGVKKYSATAGPDPHTASSFTGVLIGGVPALPMGWMRRSVRPLPVPAGDADATIPRIEKYTRVYIYATQNVGGVVWELIGPKRWVAASVVAKMVPPTRPAGVGGKWVAVDTTEQVLTAWNNDQIVFATLIASGVGKRYTPRGLTPIYLRQYVGDMSALMGTPDYYNIYQVPYVMYFNNGMALHGATWHDNFGYPMSHGCVNMTITDAHWMWDWTTDAPNAPVDVWRS